MPCKKGDRTDIDNCAGYSRLGAVIDIVSIVLLREAHIPLSGLSDAVLSVRID